MADPLVTRQFSYHTAKAFANSFLSESIYFYIGKPDPWQVVSDPADEVPDEPVDTHLNHISIWNGMAGAVRVVRIDVSGGAYRAGTTEWTTGTIYEKFVVNDCSYAWAAPALVQLDRIFISVRVRSSDSLW